MRWFLVTRKVDSGLSKVEAFDSELLATKAYKAAERRQLAQRLKKGYASSTCCLFGADRLGVLLRSHASWFDEPVDEDLLRDVAAMAAVRQGAP